MSNTVFLRTLQIRSLGRMWGERCHPVLRGKSSSCGPVMSVDNGYHTKATGDALKTVESRETEQDLTLLCSCFCPFAQRVWLTLEHKNLPYQYKEVDPYAKPKELTDIHPKGLVPAIRTSDGWGLYESTIIVEYLESCGSDKPLLSKNLKEMAKERLWASNANKTLVPAFYKLLQAQEQEKQVEYAKEYEQALDELAQNMDPEGPFFMGQNFGWVDANIAPWLLRTEKVLKPYRGFTVPKQSRVGRWIDAVVSHPAVKATTSTDELYMDSYARYAENRPNTSQVANAINAGQNLP